MRRRKVWLALSVLLMVSLVLAGCNSKKMYTMVTGGTGGTYYPLGGEIANIISDETGIEVTATTSNASADNVADISAGDAHIGFVQTDVMTYAVEGINAFEGKPVDNVLALGALYPETVQIVTLAKSGIQSVDDLKGKKVSVGAPGSGTYVNAQQILEIHGLDIESDIQAQHLDFDASVSGLQDGTIDAAFITAGTPTGSVMGLAATNPVKIVSISKDKADELIVKYPFYAHDTVAKGTYDGQDEDAHTVAVLAMLAVAKDLPEDDVYKMTKAIYENVDKLTHAKKEFIKLETALNGIGIDLHPGAEKYYKEKGLK